MPRAMWKGAVSFGLVNVPVKLYSATEAHDISFRQVHREDGGQIRYKRVCSVDGEEVSYDDIAKGYETEDGEMVIIDDADMADLPVTSSREISVEKFVPSDQIDPMLFEKSYYLEPEKNAVKPYVLLRDALEESDTVGVVKVAIRNREQLATLRVRDGVIVLCTMIWPDEIRAADFAFLDEDIELRPQEKQMATALLESMAGDFEPEQFTDGYREALEQVIDAKVEGREVIESEEPQPNAGNVVDLMSALRASVDAAKLGRGEARKETGAEAPAKRTGTEASATKAGAAKKTAARKTAARKTAARKTAAGKTTARKTSTKKAAAKTAPAEAAAPRKATARKATAKKTGPKKTAAKTAAKKTAARKAARKTA